MTFIRRGEIYWLFPEDEKYLNQLGLVIQLGEKESLFMMCHPDVRLAGHLDAVVEPRDCGLDFAIAIFTHVVTWVPHERCGPAAVGRLGEERCQELEHARVGKPLKQMTAGQPLASPLLEPRWPLIERVVQEFLTALVFADVMSQRRHDPVAFARRLANVLQDFERDDLTLEGFILLQSEVIDLHNLLIENPHVFDEHSFYCITDRIVNTCLTARAG